MSAQVLSHRMAPEDVDPLSIQPPLFETLDERNVRLAIERRAKAISDAIDAELEAQRQNERKSGKPVKVLLLGQSESGKSTTLKNFQLMYDPGAFRAQRASWRAVIQLNVVRSFHTILEAISRAQKLDNEANSGVSSIPEGEASVSFGGLDTPTALTFRAALLTPELLSLRTRLEPIFEVEKTLIRRLTTAGSGEVEATRLRSVGSGYITPPGAELESNVGHGGYSPPNGSFHLPPPSRVAPREVAINSTIPWKNAFNRLVKKDEMPRESLDSTGGVDWEDPEDPGQVLHALSEDMIALWSNPTVKQLLEKQKVRPEQLSGFFLDSLDRVTAPRYVPTDDDILRARLKTLGASEHRFRITTNGTVRDWKVFDVGGHRSQRTAWAPFFDDMDAIIFLAPISCFNEVLEEDRKVNRLEDSFKLWTMIVQNRLLRNTNLILFLNKIDILRHKLENGIMLKDHVVSYGTRPNDVENVTGYLKRKFAGILQEKSPSPRVFYCHLTTVTDTSSTTRILSNLKDMLMRQNLMKTNLIS